VTTVFIGPDGRSEIITTVIRYRVAEAASKHLLERAVEAMLNDGWQLVGGMSVHGRDIETFRQAVTKPHVVSTPCP